MAMMQLLDVTGAGLHRDWTDLYTPNAPAAVPNLDPGDYSAAFMGLSSFRTYGSRGAIIMFQMPAAGGATPRFMHWYLAYNVVPTSVPGNPVAAQAMVPETLQEVDNGVYRNEVQAGLTRFRRVDVSGASACALVPINFPPWAKDVVVTIMTRREAGWAGALNDVSSVAVALSDDPLDISKIQALYSAQKGTTPGGLGITGTVIDANHNALDVNIAAGTVAAGGLLVTKPAPDPTGIVGTTNQPNYLDPDHALRTRARALTDEGSFSGAFPGASLYRALAGTCSIAAGGTAVTGVGTAFTTACRVGDYWEITAHHNDAAPVLTQIQSIESDTAMTLRTAYAGGAAAGAAAQVCDWYVQIIDGGGGVAPTLVVAAGVATFNAGTSNGSRITLARRLGAGGRKGCAPLRAWFYLAQSVRRANQVATFGLVSQLGATAAAVQIAAMDFPGGGAAGSIETMCGLNLAAGLGGAAAADRLPDGLDLDDYQPYSVFLREDHAEYYAGRQLIQSIYADFASTWTPDPYQEMFLVLQIENTGVPAGATALTVIGAGVKSLDVVDVRPEQDDPDRLHATTYDKSIFSSGAPRAATNIADNNVHEVTDAAGAGLDAGHSYCVVQIGGAALQAYLTDAGGPAVATVRRSPFFLFNGIPWMFRPKRRGERIYVVKSVDGTANADVYVDGVDMGNGE